MVSISRARGARTAPIDVIELTPADIDQLSDDGFDADFEITEEFLYEVSQEFSRGLASQDFSVYTFGSSRWNDRSALTDDQPELTPRRISRDTSEKEIPVFGSSKKSAPTTPKPPTRRISFEPDLDPPVWSQEESAHDSMPLAPHRRISYDQSNSGFLKVEAPTQEKQVPKPTKTTKGMKLPTIRSLGERIKLLHNSQTATPRSAMAPRSAMTGLFLQALRKKLPKRKNPRFQKKANPKKSSDLKEVTEHTVDRSSLLQ